MPAEPSTSSSALLITDHDIELRQRAVDLRKDDIARIVSLKAVLMRGLDGYVDAFFRHLADNGEAAILFARRDALEQAKRLKREHWIALVAGDYGRTYVEQRIELGVLYSKHGLEARGFVGAYHQSLQMMGTDIMKDAGNSQEAFQKYLSLSKVGFYDITVISDVLIAERERIISRQQEAIRELSTPVLQLRDRLLILPIIGMIDTQRAKQLTDSLLRAIRDNRARVVVMDITGVAAVDSKVANHLLQTIAAARLMGSTVIVTGLSADVAQALVALGVDLGKINTTGDLQTGLEAAEHLLGYKVVRAGEASSHPRPD
jgi:rsbT co-antagonist protein RsbR